MNTSVFLSVIIPTYNRAHLIRGTLNSVLNQNFDSFEVIVVDDGSTDNTEEIVKSIIDERVLYFKKSNEERAAARNYGIRHATGSYVTFLDSDDLLYPHHLQTAVELIQSYDKPEICHLGYEIKNTQGKIISKVTNRKGSLNQQLIFGNSLSCMGVFIHKEIAQFNLFDENPKLTGSEDYELWLRLASQYNIVYSNKITAAIIQHDERSVLSFDKYTLIERVKTLMTTVLSNKQFINAYGMEKSVFVAHRFLYLSLHLVMGGYLLDGIKYWLKAAKLHPPVILNFKTLGIFKNVFL